MGEALGVEPGLLNDDRIGRALDAVAPHLDQIAGSVGVAAIGAFGIDVTRLHWDMASISVHGQYEQGEEGFPAPGFGHPKDRRPDLKQVQAGIAVSGDGGIPVFHRAFDGGAGEVSQVLPVMKALQQMATQRRLLIIGDSRLISYANLAAMDGDGVTFVAPASKTCVPVAQLAGLTLDAATEVGYVAQRDQAEPAGRHGRWHVVEDTMSLPGPRKSDPVLTLRRIFVHSSARAQAAVAARTKKLDRARDDLQRLERGLGSRHYPAEDKVAALFCKNNRRIAALVTVICLALLIFCLIERQVRRSLAGQGKTRVEGLYAGRPAIPTGRLILNALATMKIIPGQATTRRSSPSPHPSSSGCSTCSASTHGNSADDHPRAEYGASRPPSDDQLSA